MTLVSKEYYIKSIAADRFLDETYMSNNAPHKDDYFTNSNLWHVEVQRKHSSGDDFDQCTMKHNATGLWLGLSHDGGKVQGVDHPQNWNLWNASLTGEPTECQNVQENVAHICKTIFLVNKRKAVTLVGPPPAPQTLFIQDGMDYSDTQTFRFEPFYD